MYMERQSEGVRVADLVELAAEGSARQPAWTQRSDDLNVNLLVWDAGRSVEEHLNAEVDVLLVGIRGEGVVAVDGLDCTLRPGQALLVPKGARRSIHAGSGRFAYLTCHRRRGGLWPRGATRPQ